MSATAEEAPQTIGTRLDKVRAESAIDLGSRAWIDSVRRRRKLVEFTEEVNLEIGRLTRRASWLQRKAARLKKAANGRAKAEMEAAICGMLARTLALALTGQRTPMVPPIGRQHADRAARLLAKLQAV